VLAGGAACATVPDSSAWTLPDGVRVRIKVCRTADFPGLTKFGSDEEALAA